MKRLLVILGFLSFSLHAQIFVGKCLSYHEDKQLAKLLFDYVNTYRNSLGESSYIWEENYYVTAKKQNDFLCANGMWGHRKESLYDRPLIGTELIVSVTLYKDKFSPNIYNMIVDSCLRRWIHSDWHHEVLKAPLLSLNKTNHTIYITEPERNIYDVPLNIILSKFGAISVNVLDYGTYKMVDCIFQLGFYKDPYKLIESPYKG